MTQLRIGATRPTGTSAQDSVGSQSLQLTLEKAINWGRFGRRGNVLAWGVYAVAFVHTLVFVTLVSNPLLTQDAWYFLNAFVRHVYDGTFGIHSFYVQRHGMDHAQPLVKLVLLMELEWFRLSLMPGAIIGLLCAGLCGLLLRRFIQRETAGSCPRVEINLMWLVLGCVLISLNSITIWTWPLVALGYTSLVLAFWFFITVWRTLDTRLHPGLIASSALLGTAADEIALLSGAAALVAVLGFAWKKKWPHRWWHGPVVFFVIIGTAHVLIETLGTLAGGEVAKSSQLGAVLRILVHDGWWHWPILVLSNSVVSVQTLQWLDAGHVAQWQGVLGVALLALHVWFWRRFLRGQDNGLAFFAVCLMLLFYASVAGIIYGRVGAFGSEYLNEPRYVLFYQLNLVALALMYLAGRQQRERSPRKVTTRFGVGLAAAFLVIQMVSVGHAWHMAPYIRLYYVKMAEQTVAMARHPETTPKGCAPELPICHMPPGERAMLLAVLQQHRLNLFNDKFRRMYGFPP